MLANLSGIWRRWYRWGAPPAADWTLAHPAIATWREGADRLRPLTDQQLAATASALKVRIAEEQIDQAAAQVEAGALAQEAIRRTLQVELFDTQRLAGLVLSQGLIAQMQTGEGKTLAGMAPVLYAALAGGGVHVMTPNAYLAERDSQILRPALSLLGISSGLLQEKDNDKARQQAYLCDVTYGAGYEFGFDYLRDQLLRIGSASDSLGAEFQSALRGRLGGDLKFRQRGLAWAVIDEADSILLDEATVPLLLSGAAPAKAFDERPYAAAQRLAETLEHGVDYEFTPSRSGLRLTDSGLTHIAPALASLGRVTLERPWQQYVERALTANHLFQRDVNYVVSANKVVIVDESTGRLHADRSWKDGLHQAVETKERVPLSPRGKPQAQISRQRFLRQYKVLCGMTGTADGSEAELREAYELDVVRIPTRLPPKRICLPDRFFANRDAKWRAAVREISEFQHAGRPVLVGSRTIGASEALAQLLAQEGVACQVLNGKQSADEAGLVARAGESGMVTVATNMAGRGTDIRLGPGVREIGGLHMVGLERNPSPRVDAQLAGRVARQGDPGSCRFFVAADDQLLQNFAPSHARDMARRNNRDGELTDDVSAAVQHAQTAAESAGALSRKRLRGQDGDQRETIGRLYGVG